MTIILTNDDGIDAPGIAALFKAVKGKSVIIAAPQSHQSGCGHQVTTHQPINLQRRSDVEYAIGGTPADCIRVALSHIAQDIKYVISGINAGGNLGVDAYISGTVAAVREDGTSPRTGMFLECQFTAPITTTSRSRSGILSTLSETFTC